MPPPSPPIIKATQTAVFRLRTPSAWKRAAILDAMKRTHLATEAALQAVLEDFERIRSIDKKTERTATMQQIAYAALRKWSLSGAGAAAARVDAMGLVESYIQQLMDGRERASPPTIMPIEGRPSRYEAALLELAGTHASVARESELRDEMSRMVRPGGPRPLSLHGYGHFYRLLRHPETDRLYAWINLLPQDSRYAPTQGEANRAAQEADGQMLDIATGELVLCKRPTWLLFPLEFGLDFHERRYVLAGQPGGGRLVFRPEDGRFELHASFTYQSPATDTGRRFIGIDRGIYNLAAWSVVDGDGRVLEDGAYSGLELRHVQRVLERRIKEQQQRRGIVSITTRRAQADEAVHRTANEIVAAAKRHKARVVIEELSMQRRLRAVPKGAKGGRGGRNLRLILGRQQYAKLVQVLTYKLARVGLPAPLAVGAAYTSMTCLECGHAAAENRPKIKREGEDLIDVSRFLCARCGHAADADRNAARVIGTKGAWLVQVPTKKERGNRDLREEEKWPQYLLDAAKRRGVVIVPSPAPSSPAAPSQMVLALTPGEAPPPGRTDARPIRRVKVRRRPTPLQQENTLL